MYSNFIVKKSIIFLGIAGVGKSSIGQLLSKDLKKPFIDLDKEIEKQKNKPIQTLLDSLGDTLFLELELHIFNNFKDQKAIFSPGGSFVYCLDKVNLDNFILIHLSESLSIIQSRLHNLKTRGIVGLKNKSFSQLYAEREILAKKHADLHIECNNRPKPQIIEDIKKQLIQLETI